MDMNVVAEFDGTMVPVDQWLWQCPCGGARRIEYVGMYQGCLSRDRTIILRCHDCAARPRYVFWDLWRPVHESAAERLLELLSDEDRTFLAQKPR